MLADRTRHIRGRLALIARGSAALLLAACAGDLGTLPTDVATPPKADTALTPTPSGIAELPRVLLNTTSPAAPAPGGRVIAVAAGGDFQAALNASQPGDVIELANGASFTGNFTLPNKNTTSVNWIVIRPANFASLPAEGRRMTPTLAAQLSLPKVLSPNSNSAMLTAAGAHHFRLIGLEVSSVATQTLTYAAISLDGGSSQAQTTVAQVPHDLVLDRLYVHGFSTLTLRRCIALNSASTAIIDSWLGECHEKGADSQAIAGWNGPGPFKIVNNYLEGAGENVIFGGSDPSVPNLTPSDIEIRRNHFFKPLAWKGLWTIKNLLELKHAQRVLVEGNILENSWTDGQNGVAVALKTVNQNGNCPWCVTQDVTIRRNLIRNMGAGFNIAGSPDNNFPSIPARRIVVTDNVLANINTAPFDGDGRGFATYGSASDVVITHNTAISPTNMAFVFGPANTTQRNFVAKDNLMGGGAYGMGGDNLCCAAAFATYAPGGVFLGNVLIVAAGGNGFPTGNFYPTTAAAVGFVNLGAGDFHLVATSPYKGKATDGRDPGADVDAVNAATSGVRVP
ncbi:MAG: hypothetical protein ABI141_20175 [Gemmatimonadaceae bacterium]